MNTNHIESINIRKFKCFDDFEIAGFKRINLISGRNNVGKTAFLEACFLVVNSFNIHKKVCNYDIDCKPKVSNKHIEYFYFEYIKLLLLIKVNREGNVFFTQWLREEVDLTSSESFNIEIDDYFSLTSSGGYLFSYLLFSPNHCDEAAVRKNHLKEISLELTNFIDNKYYYKTYKKNHPPVLSNTNFVSVCNDNTIKNMVDDSKLSGKYDQVKLYLKDIFKIDNIDVIKNQVMLFQNGSYRNLSEFGDGVRHFLNIVLVLLSNNNAIIFLDEVDNGIHHSLFDELWEIILTTSKEQNIQVFATTHSQECIESYNRMAKKLNDEEITFLELFLHKEKIKSMLLDNEMLDYQISQNHEVRG